MNTTKYRTAEEKLFQECGVRRNQHLINVNGLSVKVRVQEFGDGPPLVFVHGNPNAGAAWLPLAALLQQNFRCVLIDRPGCGLSTPVSYDGLTPKRHEEIVVRTIDSVLDYFHLPAAHLIGSSSGSDWVMIYALNRPDRVLKIVHAGCPGLIENMLIPPSMKMLDSKFMLWLISRLPSSKGMAKSILRQIGHGASLKGGKISDNYLRWYVALANHTQTMINDFSYTGAVYTGGKGKANPDFLIRNSDLKKIGHPTLVLWGEEDAFGGESVGREFTDLLPHAEFNSYANSGHLPWLDNPEEHSRKIGAFLGG